MLAKQQLKPSCVSSFAALLPAVLLPGYQVVPGYNNTNNGTDNGTGNTNGTDNWTPPPTEFCPVGYYKDAQSTSWSCTQCPYGSTTLKNGSTSADDCQVPPGYFVRDLNSGEMVKCFTTPENTVQDGYYRPGKRRALRFSQAPPLMLLIVWYTAICVFVLIALVQATQAQSRTGRLEVVPAAQ